MVAGLVGVLVSGIAVILAGLLNAVFPAMSALAIMMLILIVLAGVMAWDAPAHERPRLIVVTGVMTVTFLAMISYWSGLTLLETVFLAGALLGASYLWLGRRIAMAIGRPGSK